MSFPSDLEIARATPLKPIEDIANVMGLESDLLEWHGEHVLKVKLDAIERLADRPRAKYVVVSAITPTPLGEGKTTTTVGIGQGFGHLGKRATVAVRQPSMGPTLGIKGGAAGGGYSQIVPMEVLNLHLTGDMHAVTAAHNLLSAVLDDHLYRDNALGLDFHNITWRRVLDVNDRALRNIVLGLGGKPHGVPRESGFVITAASEVMAILAMTSGMEDLRARLGRIVVGGSASGRPVTAEDLRVAGAMAVLMRDAVRPNLVQTLEGRPALVHSGPFGNIASGNSSVLAGRVGMKLADVVVTEAGFGSDLGFEKFCHLVAPAGGLEPSAAVIVATVRALRMHGGLDEVAARAGPDPEALKRGSANLAAHIENVHAFGLPAVVAVNRIEGDADSELEILAEAARDLGADEVAVCDGFSRGGAGAEDLAKALLSALERPVSFAPLNSPGTPVREQIERIATRVYGADGVELSAAAERSLARLADRGLDRLPVCMAKSHLSLSHDPALKARPRGFTLPVRDMGASVGAGFVIVLCGDQLLMPGLGREPAFTRMDVDDEGNVVGLS